jgi:hypothetical protein
MHVGAADADGLHPHLRLAWPGIFDRALDQLKPASSSQLGNLPGNHFIPFMA